MCKKAVLSNGIVKKYSQHWKENYNNTEQMYLCAEQMKLSTSNLIKNKDDDGVKKCFNFCLDKLKNASYSSEITTNEQLNDEISSLLCQLQPIE